MLRSIAPKNFNKFSLLRFSGPVRFISLQSQKPCGTLPDKIVRGPQALEAFPHPKYIMAKEKKYSTVWMDIGVSHLSYFLLCPFFALALFCKA